MNQENKLNTNMNHFKIVSSKKQQPKDESKSKNKNSWKNDRQRNREQKRGWNE